MGAVFSDAYSGDNARAVASVDGTQFYSVGNAADNTPKSANKPKSIPVLNTMAPRYSTLGATTSTKLGNGDPNFATDTTTGNNPTTNAGYNTAAKFDNFRGIGIFNGQLYASKGSGSNGVNGIYKVGNGTPTTGGQTLTVLPGLSFDPNATGAGFHAPFGFFFANPTTVYVADEGPGDATAIQNAGLEKFSFNGARGCSTTRCRTGCTSASPRSGRGSRTTGRP